MGASVSTSQTQVNNDFTSEDYASCGTTSSSNEVDLSQVTFSTAGLNCPADSTGFSINQGASVNASCAITVLQKNLADSIAKLDTNTQTGLGFSYSQDSTDISNQITTKNTTKCGAASSSNIAKISQTQVTACDMAIIQDATDQQSCIINNMQDISAKTKATTTSTTKGGSIFGDLFGSSSVGTWIALILCLVFVVIIIILIISLVAEGKKAAAQAKAQRGGFWSLFENMTGPGSVLDSLNDHKMYAVLIALVLLGVILYLIWSQPNGNSSVPQIVPISSQQPVQPLPVIPYQQSTVPQPTVPQPVTNQPVRPTIRFQSQNDDELNNYYRPIMEQSA